MVDHLDSNTRFPNPDVEIDDPLAELARIIGYDRPSETVEPDDETSESSAFDLEAELMRELDVMPLDPIDEPDLSSSDSVSETAMAEEHGISASTAFDETDATDDWLESDAVDFQSEDAARPLPDAIEADFADEPVVIARDDQPDQGEPAGPSVWDAPELDTSWRPIEPEPDVFAGDQPFELEPAGQDEVIPANFGREASEQTPDNRNDDDDVFADMVRFDLPALSRQMRLQELASLPEADVAPAFDLDAEIEWETEVSPEYAAPLSVNADGPADEGGDVDDQLGLRHLGSDPTRDGVFETSPDSDPHAAEAASAARQSDDDSVNFEDFLSAELDVYGHQIAMTGPPSEDGTAVDDHDASSAVAAWEDGDLDDQASMFDEAAEELLADSGVDAPLRELNADDQSETDGWTDDAIETGINEELTEELEDNFSQSRPAADQQDISLDDADELEFDLEQVLAETVAEDSDTQAAETALADLLLADLGAPDDQQADDDHQAGNAGAAASVQRDEIAEAFLGLTAASDDQLADFDFGVDPEPKLELGADDTGGFDAGPDPDLDAGAEDAAVLGAHREPEFDAGPDDDGGFDIDPEVQSSDSDETTHDDWLAGFESAQPPVPPAADDFYFDAGMISEPEDVLETVGEIDVPELPLDEPQSVDPDYDSEIEREIAGIIDYAEPDDRAGSATVIAGGFGAAAAAAKDWSREAATTYTDEASEDYIALERELESGDDADAFHVAAPYAAAGDENEGRSGMDGEYATGMAMEQDAVSGSRGPVLALAVLGVALLVGAGAFGWSMMSGGGDTVSTDGPRIIRADKDPVKVVPESPGGVTVPNQDKAVYDRVTGGPSTEPGQAALVNSSEEPIDVVQRTLDPELLPLEGRGDAAVKSEDRLEASPPAGDVANTAAPLVSPRKVRTMVVKPDGSIVAREEPTPEPAAAPAPARDVARLAPATPQEGAAKPTLPTPAAAEPAASDSAASAPADQTAAADPQAANTTIAPVRVVTTSPIRPVANAPVPEGRPAEQPVNVVGTVTQGGNVAATPAPAAPPPQPVDLASAPVANPGGYYVQIASQPTAEGAQASWRTLSNRYSDVLGGHSVDIQRADIAGKGVFHRVRVAAGSREQANALCSSYKAAGGSCFVSR